jgi:alanine racemase
VAILNVGYGDGVTTQFRNALFNHKGAEAKVCARVCMDMTYLLFPPGTEIERGESISLWGNDPQKFEELSALVNSIPYELVIQLTSRIPRIYQLD